MPPRAVAPEQVANPLKKQHHREAEDQHETEDQDATEDEPGVLEARSLPVESEETNEELPDDVEAEAHLLEEDDGKVEDVPQVIPEGDKEVRVEAQEDPHPDRLRQTAEEADRLRQTAQEADRLRGVPLSRARA